MGISECFLMRHALPFRIISGKLLGSYCHQTGCLSVFLSLPLASSLSPSLVLLSQWLVSFDFVLLNSPADPPLCALSSWVKGNGGALQPLCEHLVPVSCVLCTPRPPLSSSPWGVLMPPFLCKRDLAGLEPLPNGHALHRAETGHGGHVLRGKRNRMQSSVQVSRC